MRRRAGRPHAWRRSRGQALVEFALLIPVFLLVLVSIFDLGRAVFSYNTLTNAAREGARLAIVNQDAASIIAHAKSESAMVELDEPAVTIAFYQVATDGTPDTSSPCSPVAVGCLAVVQFEATYRPFTPIVSNVLFAQGVTFRAKAVLSVEYTCPTATLTAAQCPKQP